MYIYVVLLFIFLNVICDINYLTRTLISVLSGRLYQRKYSLNETTTIYDNSRDRRAGLFFGERISIVIQPAIATRLLGICTFQDCDINFKHIRLARLLRDLDFARYHFYERTGIYQRSRELGIKSLQGCTYTITADPVPLWGLYKINTKLVYWDDHSLFLEHEVITLLDGKVRSILLSRQHAIGRNGDSTQALLKGLPGSLDKPSCPEYIQYWLRSMQISSSKLRRYK